MNEAGGMPRNEARGMPGNEARGMAEKGGVFHVIT